MRGHSLIIAGWIKQSFVDYPGTIATTLFCAGCNLRCPYCHNPAIVLAGGSAITLEEIDQFLIRRRGQIDGITLTGGEPTLYDDLPAVVEDLRTRGFRVKLDTNGLLPDMIERCAPDYCALDIKTTPERYASALGAPYPDVHERLARSLAIIRGMGDHAEVRITAAPEIIDDAAIDALRTLCAGVRTVYLQPLNRRAAMLDPSFHDKPPITIDTLRRYRDRLAETVGSCAIRGDTTTDPGSRSW